MEEEYSKQLEDYVALFRRRKMFFLIPAGLVFGCALAVALLWPPVYRATARVLIEEADVRSELVESTVAGLAEKRLKVIEQRVLAAASSTITLDKFSIA